MDTCGCLEFFTNYTKMPIVAFLSLLLENKKKSSDKMLPPMRIEPGPKLAFLCVCEKPYSGRETVDSA